MSGGRVLVVVGRHVLTDGSLVFNVHVDCGDVLHAVSERDAAELADKLRAAIDAHTLERATVCYT